MRASTLRTAAIACFLAMPFIALAGEDGECEMGEINEYPQDSAIGVPLNAVLLYRDISPHWPGEYDELTICEQSGDCMEVVPLVVASDDDCIFLLRPTEPLEPNTSYIVEENGFTFTTGSESIGPLEFEIGEDDDGKGIIASYESNNEIIAVIDWCTRKSCCGCRSLILSPQDGKINLLETTSHLEDGEEVYISVVDNAGHELSFSVTVNSPLGQGCGCSAIGGGDGGKKGDGLLLVLSAAVLVFARRRGGRG